MNNEKKTAFEMLEEVKTNRNCQSVVLGLCELAMQNQGILHISVSYSSISDCVGIYVNHRDTDYQDPERPPHLIADTIDLDIGSPLEKLLKIEDQILELIAEAKDKDEVAA